MIVGGSLAGLMAAIPLLRLGHQVTIFERSPSPLLHDQGAGIVAGGDMLEFWSRFQPGGKWKQRDIAVSSQQRMYLDPQGNIIDHTRWKQRMTSWDLLYYLGRAAFDGIESDYLIRENRQENLEPELGASGKGCYEYGKIVKGVKDAGNKVEIEYHEVLQTGEGMIKTIEADLVIAADGQSSHLRHILIPGAAERTYVGYVAFRGTVPETQLSDSARELFVESFTFYHAPGCQILAYTIPGPNGNLHEGNRLVNWVWYWNFPSDSNELREVMRDRDGNSHRFTLPSGGKMQPKVWETQKNRARQYLPPQFAELVTSTTNPFVQAITDLPPPPPGTKVGRLLGGKAVLIGDALSGFRPHTAASTNQAALHALLLEKVFKGEMEWDEYEEKFMQHAKFWQDRGVMLGQRSQFGEHPMSQVGQNVKGKGAGDLNKTVVLEAAPDRK